MLILFNAGSLSARACTASHFHTDNNQCKSALCIFDHVGVETRRR